MLPATSLAVRRVAPARWANARQRNTKEENYKYSSSSSNFNYLSPLRAPNSRFKEPTFFRTMVSADCGDNRAERPTKMNSIQKDFAFYRRLALWSAYRQSDVSLSHFNSVLLRPHIDFFSGFLRSFDPLRARARASREPPDSDCETNFQSSVEYIPEDERKDSVINCRCADKRRYGETRRCGGIFYLIL